MKWVWSMVRWEWPRHEVGVVMADLICCHSGHDFDEVGSEEGADDFQDSEILWSWFVSTNCMCVCVCVCVFVYMHVCVCMCMCSRTTDL